jgi:hypothetical protein
MLQRKLDTGSAQAALGWFVCVCLVGTAGCGGAKVAKEPPPGSVEANLEAICNAYNKACRELRRSPKNLEEFKPYLKGYGDPEQLLVSPNDGQQFVIVYGASPFVEPTPANPQIIAYEKVGKDGKRLSIEPRGDIRKYTEDELARIRFPSGHKFER